MKTPFIRLISLFIAGLLWISCSSNKSKHISAKNTSQVLSNEKIAETDKTLTEVIKDSKKAWSRSEGNSFSSILHFNLESPEKVSFEITPECWIELPIRFNDNVATIYWDPLIDTKYDFPIIKTIEKVNKKFRNQPFMTLELINDSTLKALYPNSELREVLNKTDKNRLLFPDKYFAIKLH